MEGFCYIHVVNIYFGTAYRQKFALDHINGNYLGRGSSFIVFFPLRAKFVFNQNILFGFIFISFVHLVVKCTIHCVVYQIQARFILCLKIIIYRIPNKITSFIFLYSLLL